MATIINQFFKKGKKQEDYHDITLKGKETRRLPWYNFKRERNKKITM